MQLLPILLTVLFIGLKLTDSIAWPWLWVLSPLWISFALGIILLIVFFVVYKFLFKNKRFNR